MEIRVYKYNQGNGLQYRFVYVDKDFSGKITGIHGANFEIGESIEFLVDTTNKMQGALLDLPFIEYDMNSREYIEVKGLRLK